MSFVLLMLMFLSPLDRTSEEGSPEQEAATQLAKVHRIYIDILTGGDDALQIRDLLMTSLQSSKQFIITEDEDRADATLKGAGSDDVFTDTYQSSDGINAHTQLGEGESAGTRNYASSSSNRSVGITIGENENRRTEERKHEALATVRLVSKDGDIIWSATAESLGGKFLGASADVADKIAKRLTADYKLARKMVAEPDKPAPTQAVGNKPAPIQAAPAPAKPAATQAVAAVAAKPAPIQAASAATASK